MSFLARLFRPWRTETDPVPVLSESGEPSTVRSASRADTLRIDFLRPRRRDIYTQTENTIANLTSTESETVIRVPITFRPSADERYVSARRALPAKTAVAQSKTEAKVLPVEPPKVETESPPAEKKKKVDEFLLCALSKKAQAKPAKPIETVAPRVEVKRDTSVGGGESEKARVKKAPIKEEPRVVKIEEPRPSEKKAAKPTTKSQEDTFAFTNFAKKEEDTFSFTNFGKKEEEKKEEDTFSFTNFAKKDEEKKEEETLVAKKEPSPSEKKAKPTKSDEDTFSFTNFAKKEEEKKDEDTFSFTNFAKKDEPESSDQAATTFSQKKEDAQAQAPATSADDIRAKFAAIMAKAGSETVTATDDISAPKFASTLDTDFSRFSSIVNESGGFSYEPAAAPERPKFNQRPQKKRRPS